MKLVYLFNGRLPTEKAHGLQIAKMCEAFARNGNYVILLSSFRRNPITEDIFSFYDLARTFKYHRVPGIDISWLPGRLSYYFQTITSALLLAFFAKRYRDNGAVFYARDYWSLFFLVLFGLHPVAELHDYRLRAPRWYVRFLLKRSHAIVVNSNGTRELLLQQYPLRSSKIFVAPNGVDLKFFAVPDTQAEARERLGMPVGTIVGYTGRLETAGMDKGVGLLIEAMGKMERTDAVLYVIGGPDDQVAQFRKQARALGLEQRVVFVGHVEHRLIPYYLRAMDIVVLPLSPGQHALTTSPIKLFEYMAAGKIIIAADLASLREVVDDATVVFFRPGDAQDLAARIDRIVSGPEHAAQYAYQSLEKSRQYSWERRAEAIQKFICSDRISSQSR